VARALETLAQLRGGRRAIAVLGDMLELGDAGERLHAETGRKVAAAGIDVLVAVGPLSRETAEAARAAGLGTVLSCDDADAAAELVRKHARAGDVVLVKASRGMRLERVVQRLLEPR
jgi:UDP-N-acetylmuramyl pentapeptide synthase